MSMSMSIELRVHGDVDHLPHKNLLERIVHSVNEIVAEECAKRGLATDPCVGISKRVEQRPILGDDPYGVVRYSGEAHADWSVHLEAVPEVAERS